MLPDRRNMLPLDWASPRRKRMNICRITILIAGVFFAASAAAQSKPAQSKTSAPGNATAQNKTGSQTGSTASAHNAVMVSSGSEKWGDLPASAIVGTPSVDMGGTIKMAVIEGDPSQAGKPYTVRLSCTNGTKIAPHWHPTDENVTVIK